MCIIDVVLYIYIHIIVVNDFAMILFHLPRPWPGHVWGPFCRTPPCSCRRPAAVSIHLSGAERWPGGRKEFNIIIYIMIMQYNRCT